jgi:hypothetical protein
LEWLLGFPGCHENHYNPFDEKNKSFFKAKAAIFSFEGLEGALGGSKIVYLL